MKRFLVYAVFLSGIFVSCLSNGGGNGDEEKEEEKVKKNVTSRDLSISPANAYNDIFLDSAAVENHIAERKLPDSIARRMRSFYNARNYQFAWFYSGGLTEQARGFWNLHDYHTTYHDTLLHNKALQKRMDRLIAEEKLSVSASNPAYVQTELSLTQHFLHYFLQAYDKGYVKRKEMERFVPIKKQDPLYLADSLLNKKHKDNKYFEDVNEPYRLLKDQLGKYYNIVKAGGWQPVPAPKKPYRKGDSSSVIAQIKNRLRITGELAVPDTTDLFTDTLEMAVKTLQQQLGYNPTGVIGPDLIKEMNIPAERRLEQLLINMGRMRWMPQRPAGNLIVVNIPEFVLHVYEGEKRVWDMNVVVGKEGHNTMMFTGDLNQVVFSPYWNVPQSIVEKEILPAMNRNPGYLERHNMEITGQDDGLPVIRQRPGPDNSLGQVKFLFPNSFNIYFHDTNAKDLFVKSKRAYSHGCIRLAEPEKMARYLLRDQPEWTAEKIYEAMNSEKEKYVRLKDPVPVFITYYTAWVDEYGRLNFREDIYGHDESLAKKMFVRPV